VRRFERRTAPARTRRIWINDPKAGAGQTVCKIQGRAAQVPDAFVIDKKLHSVTFDYCVAFFSFAKRHLVMETGTTAFRHFYSQAFSRVFRSLRKQTSELLNSIIRDVNHRSVKYGYEVSKSK
jgi:hypothetical protein